ncbi:hypothetical protein JD844_026076 [Phrynosoma platyrhinos]|uniref:Vacuolar protein sorting-associated protein 16 homolog n=1 Tax=Phrynosoma platyrhinos TaxID=52577 RepID=A0ABQ7SEI3_PHRPL|nr:hypothetical protein JD844_026076 [Phrynosoma platyrhinos]
MQALKAIETKLKGVGDLCNLPPPPWCQAEKDILSAANKSVFQPFIGTVTQWCEQPENNKGKQLGATKVSNQPEVAWCTMSVEATDVRLPLGDIHDFSSEEAQQLLFNKFVVIMGDSSEYLRRKRFLVSPTLLDYRSVYKDLVYILQTNEMLTLQHLQSKGEETFANDKRVEFEGLHNGNNYLEARQYRTSHHLVRFYFVTRVFSAYMETVLNDFKMGLETGLIPDHSDVSTPEDLIEANFYSASLACCYRFDVLDLHYSVRFLESQHAKDGIHWNKWVHRGITKLLLTHMAEAWGVKLEKRRPRTDEWMENQMENNRAGDEGCFRAAMEPCFERKRKVKASKSSPRLLVTLTSHQPLPYTDAFSPDNHLSFNQNVRSYGNGPMDDYKQWDLGHEASYFNANGVGDSFGYEPDPHLYHGNDPRLQQNADYDSGFVEGYTYEDIPQPHPGWPGAGSGPGFQHNGSYNHGFMEEYAPQPCPSWSSPGNVSGFQHDGCYNHGFVEDYPYKHRPPLPPRQYTPTNDYSFQDDVSFHQGTEERLEYNRCPQPHPENSPYAGQNGWLGRRSVEGYGPQQRPWLPIEGLQKPPSCWTVLCQDRVTIILLAVGQDLYLLDNTTCSLVVREWMRGAYEPLKDGAYLRMAVSFNYRFLALFTDTGYLWMGRSHLKEKLGEFTCEFRAPPKQMVWCTRSRSKQRAVVMAWDRRLLVAGYGDQCIQYPLDEDSYLVPELDGKESQKADEYLREIKDQNLLPEAVRQCIEAASYEHEPEVQKSLLRAASFGKCFIDKFPPESFVETCRDLRICYRDRCQAIFLSTSAHHQCMHGDFSLDSSCRYRQLTTEVLLDRLVLRRLYPVAIKICEYLRLSEFQGISRILAHWACYKVQQKDKSDEEVAQAINQKLGDTPGISYSEIAARAYDCGRTELAIKLLEYEPRSGKQVPLLLKMKRSQLALSKAIESGDTDLVYTVILHLKNELNRGAFFMTLQNQPVAMSLYRQATEDQIKLLRFQRRLQDDFDKPYLDYSLHDTVYNLILEGNHKRAEQLYRDFKIPDKRFWWLKISALAEQGDWEEMEKDLNQAAEAAIERKSEAEMNLVLSKCNDATVAAKINHAKAQLGKK